MNFIDQYEAELREKAAREIAKEDAIRAAMTEGERTASDRAERKKRVAEMARQRRIARQHDEIYGKDDNDD
jgi:hypothetical protein